MTLDSLRCPSCGIADVSKISNHQYKCNYCACFSTLSTDNSMLIVGGIRCSSCGCFSEVQARFCRKCGIQLAKFCALCGQQLPRDDRFCTNCGGQAFVHSSSVSFILLSVGSSKIKLIKTVREITGLGLKEAKELVETPNAVLATGLAYFRVGKRADLYQEAGAEVLKRLD